MKFMYLRGSIVHEIEGESADEIAARWRVTLGWPIAPSDLKLWLPEDQRCAYRSAEGWRPCVNPRRGGSDLCGFHAAQSKQQELLRLQRAVDRKLDAEAEAVRERIEAATNVRARTAGREGVVFSIEQAQRLVEWLEAHQENS
jgi:hypothetical protein